MKRPEGKAARRPGAPPRRTASSRALYEKSVGAVVWRNDGSSEYLLIYSTFWEFPKGHVDANESESETAQREIHEETGLEVEFTEGFRDEINYMYRRAGTLIKKQVVFLLARAKTHTVKLSSEHSDFVWLPFDAALEKLRYENSRAILKKANAFLAGTAS